MAENEKLVPKRRFSEFQNTQAWVQSKLGEVADIVAGGDIDKEKIKENGQYPVLANALTNDGIVGYYDAEYRIEAPAVTVTGRGDVGHAQVRKLNFTPVVRLLAVKSSHDAYFLENAINTKETIVESTGVPQLTVPHLKKYEIWFPTRNEQTNIGNFFLALDDTITIQQRKLEKTKALKSAYLSEMFPAEGERVPKRRFAGFTDEWEQRKLGDIAEFSKGKGYSKNDLSDKGNPIILYGRLYTNYETVITNVDTFAEIKGAPILSHGGEVIVPSSGETAEDIARASVVANSGVILGGDLNIVKPNSTMNSAFLAINISNGNQQKELSKRAQGKSVVHLSNSDLKDVILQFPKESEQTAIGNFFRTIDNFIAHHQKKLDKLQNIKKAYLNEMFI